MLWAVRMRNNADRNAARAARAEAAAAVAQASGHQAEATALRLQLNPHFLFNALNSVSSLVLTDRKDQAEEMIGRLCQFLRASLSADPAEDVPLSQEIESLDAYLSIEEARFGDRLQVEISVEDDAADALVPNFILQPLVENAVKHGVAAVPGQARLAIAAAKSGDTLLLSVTNSSASLNAAAQRSSNGVGRLSTGIGLINTRQRLVHRYGDEAQLETRPSAQEYSAIIRIPFASARDSRLQQPSHSGALARAGSTRL
jgi:LytS/YehU family sensor histidine kinase